jgi:hypothetical protein
MIFGKDTFNGSNAAGLHHRDKVPCSINTPSPGNLER